MLSCMLVDHLNETIHSPSYQQIICGYVISCFCRTDQPYRINIYKPYKFSCLVTKLCGLLLECVANNFVSITHQELGVRYAAVHLPASGQAVVLECMGKTWKTQMVIHNGRRWFLNGGWAKFARDNGLRVDDICLFDLK